MTLPSCGDDWHPFAPWRVYCSRDREREMTPEEQERAAALARAVREAEAAGSERAPNLRGILMGYVRRPPAGRGPSTTDAEAESWAEAARLDARAARRQRAKRDGYRYTVDDLLRGRVSLAEAEERRGSGLISEETLDAYAYAWRDARFRYSDAGRRRAATHARRLGLPLPLSDVEQAERDRRREAGRFADTAEQLGGGVTWAEADAS